ncbi:ATP-binding cassette domain-containing protein [Pseudonocardia humida]|uniref:ATP-binding cassette domain-containing protein n=1 Tax=Pseudonocardia humida TaxID=2800819 RepID=UPI0027E32C29|nr:ATP-binding cassette domain-containing protein [Pseudonocardia humida]
MAVRGIDLEVRPGECSVVVGADGTGESTLLRCLRGEEPVTEGAVLVDGAPPAAAGRGDRPSALGAADRRAGAGTGRRGGGAGWSGCWARRARGPPSPSAATTGRWCARWPTGSWSCREPGPPPRPRQMS